VIVVNSSSPSLPVRPLCWHDLGLAFTTKAENGIFAIYKWVTEGTQTNKQMYYIHTDHLGSYEIVSKMPMAMWLTVL